MLNLTPSPTPIPLLVRKELARNFSVYHRSEEFKQVYRENRTLLQYLFQTCQPVFTLTGSGTAAMEMCVANFDPEKCSALYIDIGKFSARWGEILKAYGFKTFCIKKKWGESVSPDEIELFLRKHNDIFLLYLIHSETSTGVSLALEDICRRVKSVRPEAVIIVDAVTGAGIMPLYMDRWNIDLAFTSSQKALGCPPGLSFVACNARVRKFLRKKCVFYFDLQRFMNADENDGTPFTPAVTGIFAANASLAFIRREGLPARWEHHKNLSVFCRSQLQKMNIRMLAGAGVSSWAITAFFVPYKQNAEQIILQLKNEYRILIAHGQQHYRGRVLRIAHMGYTSEGDVAKCLKALRNILHK